jgi:hypothetical protein
MFLSKISNVDCWGEGVVPTYDKKLLGSSRERSIEGRPYLDAGDEALPVFMYASVSESIGP